MNHIPALDGARALAVVLVMVFHSSAPFLRTGYIGVDIFFVLSGFLITSVLLTERERTGTIAFGRFYLRRFARLTPPLALCLLLYIALAPLLWPDYESHLRDAALSATYLTDYSQAFWLAPKMLRHTWSLSVEEHFYLIWPFVIVGLAWMPRSTAMKMLAAMYVLATAWRFFCIDIGGGWNAVYYRFDTRLSGLILGSFLSASLRQGQSAGVGQVTTAAGIASSLYLLVALDWGDNQMLKYGVMLAELLTALCISAIMNNTPALRWLGAQSIAYIGRLSYGLYLFHYPAMVYLRAKYDWELVLIGGSTFAFLAAALSYHTIEASVRRWKARATETPLQSASTQPAID